VKRGGDAGYTVSHIASDLGIGANILGRWQRELRQAPKQALVGKGDPVMKR
jgi:transposase-like protein